MSRALLVFGLAAVAVVAAYWTLLFFTQRAILFPAPPAPRVSLAPPGTQVVWLSTSFGSVEAWFLPPTAPAASPVPVLLFTHGNGEIIDFWPQSFDEPRDWGMGVLLVEYPGYGRSAGHPSQASITETMLAACHWVGLQPGLDATRLVPYGRSLGGAVAAVLSEQRPVPAMVLESAFTSVAAFSARMGAPAFLVRDPLDTVAAVRKFDGPILVLHGDRDDIVPTDHGRAIAAAARRATLTLLPCGHNDCDRPWTDVRRFFEAAGILRSPAAP
jgi:fermentation-respiration switch protein FrsA (DUF1100 family)